MKTETFKSPRSFNPESKNSSQNWTKKQKMAKNIVYFYLNAGIISTSIPEFDKAITNISNKMETVFKYRLPADVEWRTSNHPDYKKDREHAKKDHGGFITSDYKKIYLINLEPEDTYEDFVAHELGHFFDRHLNDLSLKIDASPAKNTPKEIFAMMVNYVLVDGHSGGPIQTKMYNTICDKLGIINRVKPGKPPEEKKALFQKVISNFLNSNINFKNKEQYFKDRTRYHTKLVNKYLDKIIELEDLRLNTDILKQEKEAHDKSKFKEPEFSPYQHITYKYYLKDQGKEYNPEKDIKDAMQEATFHHCKFNKHHPEAWDENLTIDNINKNDRDKPAEITDATKMPLSYIACMVADWCAVSEERDTNPYKWADMNMNKRWKFTENQVKLIYDLLGGIW